MLGTLLLAAVAGLPLAQAGDAPVVVDLPPPAPGGTPTATVRATGAAVHLPSCRGVTWQSFDAESGKYAPIDEPACGPLQPATRIDKDGTTFALPVDPGAARAVRAVVVVGLGCAPDAPFPLAGCAEVTVVESAPAMLRAAPKE